MNILYLTHRIPYPPNKGDKIRSYHLLAHLARRGAVDLVTHVDDPRDLRHQQILADLCRSVRIFPLNPVVGRLRVLAALAGRAPLSMAYMTRPGVARVVRELIAARGYDVVVAFSSQVVAYLDEHRAPPLLMDLVDVDSEKWAAYGAVRASWRGILHRLECRRLRVVERRLGQWAHRLVVTTEREAAAYRENVGPARLVAISNGIVVPDRIPPVASRSSKLMIFVGAMDYEANAEAAETAAREVLPRVRAAVPGVRFRIVGRNPTARVRALAALDGVEVTGEVADLRPHLEAATLALIPLRVARGIQNKVLEALAYGLPVVATPDVPASLAREVDGAIFAGRDAGELAAQAVRLLGSEALRRRAADAGRQYVAEHHDWRQFDAHWDRLLDEIRTTERTEVGA